MAVERFLPDAERTRRVMGWIFAAIALALIGGLIRLEVLGGQVTMFGFVLFLLLGGFLSQGLRLALVPKDLLEVNLENRTYSVTRKGTRSGSGALNALGPLEVRERMRGLGVNDDRSTSIEYVVCAAVHSKLDLYTATTADSARLKMESLARAWRLPCRSLGGAVRRPDDLGRPLHERLRDDRESRTAMPLRPEWGVRIEPLSLGYAIHFTQRSWAPLRASGLIVALALFVLSRGSHFGLLSALSDTGDLVGQILTGLLVVLILVLFWIVGRGVRDTFFPGTVRVTDEGVTYRGGRMAFRQIEEVTATYPIEVVGDGRRLALGSAFCPPGATKAVAHELQRLIIEVAEASPHARSR